MIKISYDFDPVDPTGIIIDICKKTRYIRDFIDRITARIDGHDVSNGMTVVIAILIKVSDVISFLDPLTINFYIISSISDKTSEYGYEYGNNINTSITINNFCKIRSAAIIAGFCLTVVYFIVQVVAGSLSNIALSNQFDAIVIATGELVINLIRQSSIGEVYCDIQATHNVCSVYYSFLFFQLIFVFLF